MTTVTPEALRRIKWLAEHSALEVLDRLAEAIDRLDAAKQGATKPEFEYWSAPPSPEWGGPTKQGATTDSGGMKPDREAGLVGAGDDAMKRAPQSASASATHSAASVAGAVDIEALREAIDKLEADAWCDNGNNYVEEAKERRKLVHRLEKVAAALETLDKRWRRYEALLSNYGVIVGDGEGGGT